MKPRSTFLDIPNPVLNWHTSAQRTEKEVSLSSEHKMSRMEKHAKNQHTGTSNCDLIGLARIYFVIFPIASSETFFERFLGWEMGDDYSSGKMCIRILDQDPIH